MQRHRKATPCPICGGHPDMPRGQGLRCAGWVSDDGQWIHCSREERAGEAPFHAGSQTYSHRARGRCRCGEVHAEDPKANDPPARRRRAAAAEVRQIGDTPRAKIVATYDYKARDGTLLYQVCRTEPKSFRQRRPDGRGGWLWNMQGQPTTLYRIPELFAALDAGDSVFIAEGEKDVEALWDAGAVATCNTGGAGKWRDELAEPFRLAQDRIDIVQDRDEEGRKHARDVLESLAKVVGERVRIRIVEAAAGKDAADHLGAGHGLADFRQVWPIPEDLLERDPQAFKRMMLRQALQTPQSVLEHVVDGETRSEAHPLYAAGLIGTRFLKTMLGVTVVSGGTSAGKSMFAMSTAIDAVLAGWDAFYLSAEMHKFLVFDRAVRAYASADLREEEWYRADIKQDAIERAKTLRLPERFHHVNVELGVRIEDVIEFLSEHVTHRPTLVVLDSISSFIDNMDRSRQSDAFGMGALVNVMKWIVSVRKFTHGHVSFLVLAEPNKEGKAKGRFLEHRADLGIAMASQKDSEHVKEVRITKNWWGPTGLDGQYVVEPELGRLRRDQTS